MTTNEWTLKVSNLSKQFNSNPPIHAIHDLSFQLSKGNVLGIIGDNGAGKSTLLRIISGLTKPDKGAVSYRGNLSYILDIGSSFHSDLSGIDNIYMAGNLIGLSNKQIKESLKDIIDFSELQNFIHAPLKYYSSGMFLRLAFSTLTFFKTDILVLDEIMSVGDIHFQQKSRDRILEIVKGGRTVILAGHNIEEFNNLCSHGLWLTSGKQTFFGEINEVVDRYLAHTARANTDLILPITAPENNDLSVESGSAQTDDASASPLAGNATKEAADSYTRYISLKDDADSAAPISLLEAGIKSTGKSYEEELYMDDELEIMIRYQKKVAIPCIISAVIQDKFGHIIMSLCAHRPADKSKFVDNSSAGVYRQTVAIPPGVFNHGIFSVSFFFVDAQEQELAVFKRSLFFKIHKSDYSFDIFTYKSNFPGSLFPFYDWTTQIEQHV